MDTQQQALNDLLAQLISEGKIEVPMLPEVANKALSLAQSPDSDAGEMAKLIQADQSLAGHVMRIANSVAYTPLANLVSLQQAIARLGMTVISEIALTAAIGAKMFNTPGYEPYVAKLWRHALATSLWAKEIARHCRSNVEVAFISGLLHSIGRPAVLQAILELAEQQDISLSEDDLHNLENTFCHQVSQSVVTQWKMPSLVIDAISTSHDADSSSNQHVAVVYAAAHFAHYMLQSNDVDKDSLLKLPVLASLNLYQDEVEKLIEQTDTIKSRLEGLSS